MLSSAAYNKKLLIFSRRQRGRQLCPRLLRRGFQPGVAPGAVACPQPPRRGSQSCCDVVEDRFHGCHLRFHRTQPEIETGNRRCGQHIVDVTLTQARSFRIVQGEGVSMKLVVFGVAMVLAATGAAVAKEKKKVATAQAAISCPAAHMKAGSGKPAPKLDCKSTGTVVVARPSNQAANFLDHRLGYDTDPWIPTGY